MGRVLVAYATRYGSTTGVAEAIGRAPCEAGLDADGRPARQVRDVGGYDSVVAGAPVYAGLWHGDVKRFVKRHHRALSGIPVTHFVVGLAFHDMTDEHREVGLKATRPTAELVVPVEYGFFAGATQQLPRFFAKTVSNGGKSDDLSDWDAIASWAKALAPKIAA